MHLSTASLPILFKASTLAATARTPIPYATCSATDTPSNCAGTPMREVMIQCPNSTSTVTQQLLKDAVTQAGGIIREIFSKHLIPKEVEMGDGPRGMLTWRFCRL